MEYRIFIDPRELKPSALLNATCVQVVSFLEQYTRGFIWQFDDFNLRVITPSNEEGYLFGKTRFGDSVEVSFCGI